jgi:hypothetical protein
MSSGDVVIQRGTNHRWVKVKDGKPVKMLICLVDGGEIFRGCDMLMTSIAEFGVPGTSIKVKDEVFSAQ